MGWTVEGPAVALHAEAGTTPLRATSTSTVRLPGMPARLRMYGPDEGIVAHSLADPTAWGELVGANPCGLAERAFTYLDGMRSGLFGPLRFDLHPGTPPLAATCVPAHRGGVTWSVRGAGGGLDTVTFDVIYKDPSVVRLPDGRWLLTAARYRVPASDPPRDRFPALPGASLGDIVAWRAEDPAFTQGVTGPYWLVDAAQALPGETRPAWLGVPGVVVAGRGADLRLDVYYVVEAGERPEPPSAPPNGPPEGPPNGPPNGPPKGPPNAPPNGPPNGPSDGGSPERPPAPPPRGIGPGVAVKRLAWSELGPLLDRPYPDEAEWESGGALPGALLGRVNVWTALDTPGNVARLEDTFGGLRLADPAPLDCRGISSLFVAAIYAPGALGSAPTGHGAWRAAGVPDGAALCEVHDGLGPCTPLAARQGVDFLIARGGAGSTDRVLATTPQVVYGDPDPVALPWGKTEVLVGDLFGRPDGPGLAVVQGSHADACRPWTATWAGPGR